MTRTVYIGFMDEEVAPVLRKLLATDHVLVVERQAFDTLPTLLFEVLLSNLPTTPWIRSTTDPDKVVGQAVEGKLGEEQLTLTRALQALLSAPDDGFLKKLAGRTFFESTIEVSRQEKARRATSPPALSVFAFPSESPAATAITVLVRAPEMGMQPTLVRPYLRLILKAVRSLVPADETVNLRAFGASGAISQEAHPGRVHTMAGSVFVGAEADEGKDGDGTASTGRRLHSLVVLATPQGRAEYHHTTTELVPQAIVAQADGAEREAREALARAGELKHTTVVPEGAPGPWDTAPTLAGAIKALREGGRKVSLTTSFFVDSDLKGTARGLGLDAANTEDYHVLRLAESMTRKLKHDVYPPLKEARVFRVDADPAEIGSEIIKGFQVWAARHAITGEQVAGLIGWGLRGTPLAEVSAVPGVFWSFADDVLFTDPVTAAKYFLRHGQPGALKPLDPFAVEIAIDLLKDLREGTAFAPYPGTVNDLTEWASAVSVAVPGAGPGGVEQLLATFPALWNNALETMNVAPGSVWVRRGKWRGNENRWLSRIQVEASVVDRAFYRSANLVALLDAADEFTRH